MAIGMFFGFLLLGRLLDEDVRVCVGWALILVSLASGFNSFVAILFTPHGRNALYKSLSSGSLESLEAGSLLPSHHGAAASSISSKLPTILQRSGGLFCNPTIVRASVGIVAGVLTVIANVAGPVVAVYLMGLQLPKRQLNGTRAWLFLISNACKVPGQLLLGNLRLSDWSLVVPLCIAAALSTYATELFLFPRIEQRLFERLSWRCV